MVLLKNTELEQKDSIEKLIETIRDHWSIECGLHWKLDVILDENNSRNSINNSINKIKAGNSAADDSKKNSSENIKKRYINDFSKELYDLYIEIKESFSDFEEVKKLKEANELILKNLNQEQELFSKESQLFSFEKIKYDIPQETAENIEKMISSVDSEFSKVALAVLKNRLALRIIDEKCNKR